MKTDFLINQSKLDNLSPLEEAKKLLSEKTKIFPFRYSKKGLEEVLYAPKYKLKEISKMYQQALKKGITKVANAHNTDVRKLKMYFLVNGLSVEKIYSKRNKIIAQTNLNKLDEPYYEELKQGKDFDKVAEKYHFDKKMRKNVVRNLKTHNIEINRKTTSEKSKEQAIIYFQNFVNKYGMEIANKIMGGQSVEKIRSELKEKYGLNKCPVQKVVDVYFKENYQHLLFLFKKEEKQLEQKRKYEERKFSKEKRVKGYIYRITNTLNGKTYIGQHKKKYFDNKYYGSGVLVKEAVRKYGKYNFTQSLLKICSSQEELDKEEQKFIKLEREKGHAEYNITDGGKGAKGIHQNGNENPFYGHHHTKETKEKLSKYASQRTGKLNPFYGHKMTLEHLVKTRRTGSVQSKETRKKISNAEKKMTKCPDCFKIFPSYTEMKKHYKKVHTPLNKERHLKELKKANSTIFICPYCSKEIHSKGNLTQHVRAFHQERLEEYNQIKDNLKPKGNESEE